MRHACASKSASTAPPARQSMYAKHSTAPRTNQRRNGAGRAASCCRSGASGKRRCRHANATLLFDARGHALRKQRNAAFWIDVFAARAAHAMPRAVATRHACARACTPHSACAGTNARYSQQVYAKGRYRHRGLQHNARIAGKRATRAYNQRSVKYMLNITPATILRRCPP